MSVSNGTERKAWYDQLRAKFAEPDGTVEVRDDGREYARTLAKVCPQCEVVFYTYQQIGHERQPYRQDPDPSKGQIVQSRETCGSPRCWDQEMEYQSKRHRTNLNTVSGVDPDKEPKKVQGLVPLKRAVGVGR